MILSPNRERNKQDRLRLLKEMHADLRAGRTKTALAIGQMTKYLAHKIATYDYTKIDELDEKLT